MRNKTVASYQAKGFAAGVAAFARGVKCVPALDSELPNVVPGLPIGAESMAVLKGWIAGWTAANIAKPV